MNFDPINYTQVLNAGRRTPLQQEIAYISASSIVTSRINGIAKIRCLGAGGAGARGNFASGGNGGTVGVKTVPIKVGDQLTVTIPAGGAAVPSTATDNGGIGGALTVTGAGVDIYVPGGSGGVQGAASTRPAANGVPTGLDWYILGGFGGMSANSSGAGGGGGAALLVGGGAWNGGDCDATTTSAGGAGVGGSGSKNSSGTGGYAGGSGGSASGDAHGPSINGTDIYNNNLATAIQDIRHSIVLVPVTGAGGLGRQSPGGGGGGSSGITQGGGFGAGGGAISASGASSGKGGTGGGGAGQNMSYGYTSGAGGAGFVCIEFLETAL